jgi:broad specificity phosphatase PhoE
MNPSRQLILVRHGETEWNVAKRLNSRTDIPLSKEGARHVEQLSRSLTSVSINRCYSSPSLRTMQTAKLLTAQRECAIIQDERLREIDFGAFEGLSAEALETENASKAFNEWRSGILSEAEATEPLEQAAQRAREFFETVAACPGTTLVVGHGYILRILIATCVLMSEASLFRRLRIDNASVSVVEWSAGNDDPLLVVMNGLAFP